jgi:hypothetical protein
LAAVAVEDVAGQGVAAFAAAEHLMDRAAVCRVVAVLQDVERFDHASASNSRGRNRWIWGKAATKLTTRQADVAHGIYAEVAPDGKHRYTVAEIADTFGVSRKTIYRHLDPTGTRRQPDKTARTPAAATGKNQ